MNILDMVGKLRGKVTVIGDIILDVFWSGFVERQSSEANVPIILVTQDAGSLGGAGNTAHNIVSLNGQCSIISVVGRDYNQQILDRLLRRTGIDDSGLIIDQERQTTTKIRVLNGEEQLVCVAHEQRQPIRAWHVERIMELVNKSSVEVIVVSDYARGMVTPELMDRLIPYCHQYDIKLIVDVRPRNDFPSDHYKRAYLITPNRQEAAHLLGLDQPLENGAVAAAARQLVEQYDTNVLLTQDGDGMTLFNRLGVPHRYPARNGRPVCVSGAGDTVVATVALALASEFDLHQAVELSSWTAAAAISQPGTTAVTPAMLRSFVDQHPVKKEVAIEATS